MQPTHSPSRPSDWAIMTARARGYLAQPGLQSNKPGLSVKAADLVYLGYFGKSGRGRRRTPSTKILDDAWPRPCGLQSTRSQLKVETQRGWKRRPIPRLPLHADDGICTMRARPSGLDRVQKQVTARWKRRKEEAVRRPVYENQNSNKNDNKNENENENGIRMGRGGGRSGPSERMLSRHTPSPPDTQ